MDVGGAALYSVAVMGARGVSYLAMCAGRIMAAGWRSAVEDAALHGASSHSTRLAQNTHSNDEQSGETVMRPYRLQKPNSGFSPPNDRRSASAERGAPIH